MGSVLESRLAFLRAEGGEPLVRRVVDTLPEQDRAAIAAGLKSSEWYPCEFDERIDLAIAKAMGKGDAIFRELGAYSAVHNLGAAHKVYVRERNPHGLLEKAATIFTLYYDSGHREYRKLSPNSAALRTYDCRSFSLEDCLTVVGWHEKAIELCGGKNPRVTEPICRAKGGVLCEYICEWDGLVSTPPPSEK
jgi:hypothetical protein